MKKKYILMLIVLSVFIIGCQKSSSSPEETVKAAVDSLIKGNYDKTFGYFIDRNGNPPSNELRDQFKANIKQSPISNYQILGTSDITPEMTEYNAFQELFKDKKPIFDEIKIVKLIAVQGDPPRNQESSLILVKYKGSWKILTG